MAVLALETSDIEGGVALLLSDNRHFLRVGSMTGASSRQLLPDAQALLAEAGLTLKQVTLLAVSVGPGAFTGIRVGLASAKSLAWALDIPLVCASSLETLAQSVESPMAGLIAPTMDARRGEVYGALFRRTEDGGLERCWEDRVLGPELWAARLAEQVGDAVVTPIGRGASRYRQLLCDSLGERLRDPIGGPERSPSPLALAQLGNRQLALGKTTHPALAAPNYLRSHGAQPPASVKGL